MPCSLDHIEVFDMVNWNTLRHILNEFGVTEHLIMIIQKLYERNIVYVEIDGQLFERFQTGNRVRQSYILTPMLYNLYNIHGEWIMQKASESTNSGITAGGGKTCNLRCADDTVLLAANERELICV